MGYEPVCRIAGEHRVDVFDSGVPELDLWLARFARQADAAGSARSFVALATGNRIAGFYALAAGSLRPGDAPSRVLKGQPLGRAIPVIVLARLAVDRRDQGQGLGRSLLQDALLRCAAAADSIGVRAVVVHATDGAAREWYLRFGFEPSPTDPMHLILLGKDLRRFLKSVE